MTPLEKKKIGQNLQDLRIGEAFFFLTAKA